MLSKDLLALASQWRQLGPKAKLELYKELPPELKSTVAKEWPFLARDTQMPPEEWGDKPYWVILSGRGWGKSRTGSETTLDHVEEVGKDARIALVGSTASDVRDTMIEGESGILACAKRRGLKCNYEPSKRRITFDNGAIATSFSAEEPNRLRGPQHTFAWCDEMCAWTKDQETFDMLMFGLRLGNQPRIVVTTTPKPRMALRELVHDDNTVVTKGSTFENKANLAPQFIKEIKNRYEGTRLGKQEIYGEILLDNPDALWSAELIDPYRIKNEFDGPDDIADYLGIYRVAVAVDPAVTSGAKSDSTGLVVVGQANEDEFYVLEDATCKVSPDQWAQKACDLYYKWQADVVVAEVNQGGDLVEKLIRMKDRNINYKAVRASKGKRTRAEPVAALYEQGKVSHVGLFQDLESQMCDYCPDSNPSSPDRVDALVWGLTELALEGRKKGGLFFL